MSQQPTRRLYRSREHRMISGVAGGIAEYMNVDPTVVRVVMFLALLVTTGPFGILVYAALALMIPNEPVDARQGGTV